MVGYIDLGYVFLFESCMSILPRRQTGTAVNNQQSVVSECVS